MFILLWAHFSLREVMLMMKERWHEAKTLTLTMAKESVRSCVGCFVILAPILQRCRRAVAMAIEKSDGWRSETKGQSLA